MKSTAPNAATVLLLVLVGCTPVLATAAQVSPTSIPLRTDNQTSQSSVTPVARSPLRFSTVDWKTDFSRHSVPLEEITSGGPPRDGIPPIDQPRFILPAEAGAWLNDNEPVIAFEWNGDVRAYPIQILIWHEIVNDTVGEVPVMITFCPLCNTAIAFDRRVNRTPLRFGTSGNLRNSDLVMWDDRTESWWQQITGEAIVGDLTGTKLTMLPVQIVSFADFKTTFPNGVVLSRDTGFQRTYGSNPYTGYDNINSSPFLFSGVPDRRLPPMQRVVTVELNGEAVAYPFDLLQQRGVVADTVGGTPIIVFWTPGTTSALDQRAIAGSRDVGATGVYRPVLQGQSLTFDLREGSIVDSETGSTWNVLGLAVSGPLAGQRLEPIVHADDFWFAWAVFKPDTRIAE
jgi:hypothetical protein